MVEEVDEEEKLTIASENKARFHAIYRETGRLCHVLVQKAY